MYHFIGKEQFHLLG